MIACGSFVELTMKSAIMVGFNLVCVFREKMVWCWRVRNDERAVGRFRPTICRLPLRLSICRHEREQVVLSRVAQLFVFEA